MRRHFSRYLGMGLAVLLVLAALFVPQGWFARRDAASVDRVHGEALSPLMVAQLDSRYEQDIHDRMSAYMGAMALQDVMCSSKEIDPNNESLWDNIGQAENTLLVEVLRTEDYMRMDEEEGWDSVIESCTQYVLMRKSDGQILLVANDIRLDKGNGCHMELLIDGVDGTVYYLESEEDHSVHWLRDWLDDRAWNWWWILNDTYYTEDAQILNDGSYYEYEVYEDTAILSHDTGASVGVVYDGVTNKKNMTESEKEVVEAGWLAGWVRIFNESYPNIWVASAMNKDIYCCRLAFGEIADSWAMEIEMQDEEDYVYRIRLGLPGVVNLIPDMAQRISLAEYNQIYQMVE